MDHRTYVPTELFENITSRIRKNAETDKTPTKPTIDSADKIVSILFDCFLLEGRKDADGIGIRKCGDSFLPSL